MSCSVSVIIVNYNTTALLERCLESLFSDGHGLSIEIIVVDNYSSDKGLQKTIDKYQNVLWIRNEENLGFAKACNQGLKMAKADYVLFLNPDTIISKKNLDQCLTFMDTHGDIGLLGCTLLNGDGSLQPSCADFPYLHKIFLDHLTRWKYFPQKLRSRWLLRYWPHDTIRDVDWVLGAFMLTRRKLVDQLKGFDEDYFLYGEDLDLCYRIRKAGWRVTFFSDAAVFHAGNPIWDQARKDLVYDALLKFYGKHFPKWTCVLLQLLIHLQQRLL